MADFGSKDQRPAPRVRCIASLIAIAPEPKHDQYDREEAEHKICRAVFKLLGDLREREYGILLIEAHAPRVIDAGQFTGEAADDAFSQERTEGVHEANATLRIAGLVLSLDVAIMPADRLFIEAQLLPKSVPGDGDDQSGICSDGLIAEGFPSDRPRPLTPAFSRGPGAAKRGLRRRLERMVGHQ